LLPNQINPNLNIFNNPNNNFYEPYQMNLYQNATQMPAIPYNFPTAYGYGFNPNMPLGFPMSAHPYAFNTFSNGFFPNFPNSAAHAATGFSAYPKENLIVSSIAEIEYISNNNLNYANNKVIKTIKKQNTDRSNQENSKIIKVKTKEIIAIDKKDNNQNVKKSSNKINDSNHLNIKTDENAFDLKNEKNKNSFDLDKKEKESKKEENYGYDSYAQNSSIFTKQLAEDLSIQDEIEYKKPEKKNTQKSFNNVSLKDSNKININNNNNSNSNYLKKNISIKKTESNLMEEENSQLNLDKFHSKKSLLKHQQTKISKMQNSIDEDIRSDKDITNMSNRIATEKSAKIAAESEPQNNEEFYEDSFKKSFHNSNISENLSYKSYKKSKKDIITNFDDFNNKENSIDDIIDSKSLKDFENEIHSDFKNDQPVIEESKKSIDVKDTSPKNLALQPSRVITEMKYEKLEVINEESILDKSKSNLKEINNNYNNNANYKNDFENNENLNIFSAQKLQQMQNSEIEDDYEENFEIAKSRKNPRNHPHNNINSEIDEKAHDYNHNHLLNLKNFNDNKEENKQYAHETFDSLKTHTQNSHKEENEKIEEENYNNEDKNHKNTEEIICEKLADVIKTGENYYFEDQNIQEAEHNNISEYSSISRKNKAASKKSNMLFEELKEKALYMCEDEVFPLKIEERLEEEGITENKNSTGEKEEEIINNKSIIKTEEAKPLENSQNQIIEEEQVEDKIEIHKKNENQQEAEKIKEETKSEKEEEQEIQLVRKTEENNALKTINNNNEEIQEDENLEIKNQDEKLNKSSEQKKEKTEPNEEEINFKNENNANKKTDSDAIVEEKHLESINQSINKSFKSIKSDKAYENNQQENKAEEKERKEEIEISQANKSEQIIKEEEKDEAKDATKENLISLPNKTETENNHKEIEVGAALKIQKKGSFSSLKNNIKINFLNNQQEINDFDIIYNAYKAKLNNAQKVTFKPKESIDDYLSCFNPKIIKISNEANELIGLCCISFDNFWEDSVKININHVSVLDFEFFQNLVGTVLEFIKENFPADEILIELHYEFKDSNFEINTEIRDVFKNAFKFKWHKLENRNGERLQKMGLTVQGADDEKKNQISKFMNSTLEINHFSVMNFINKSELDLNNNVDPTKEEGNNINSDLTHLNYFNLVASLCQIHGGKKSVKSEMLEKYDKLEIKVIF